MATGPSDVTGTSGGPAVIATTGVPDAASARVDALAAEHGGWFDPGGPPAAPFDVAVIGAGPAGLAAAVAAIDADARVALIDAGPRIGGQYWRHRPGDDRRHHHDRSAFVRLRDAVETAIAAGTLVHLGGVHVWHVERASDGFVVHGVVDGEAREVRARSLVLATGAYDRQVPFPGWTLPGVYTAGAAQALLKGHGVVVGRRVVVSGTGPFLFPVATALADAGATVLGVFEAGRPTTFARHPLALLRNVGTMWEAAGYLRTLRAAGVPYRTRTAVVAALGEDELTGVRVATLDEGWHVVPGTEREIECDALAVGYGFTPQPELALQLGCDVLADADGSLVTRVDDDQASSVDGVFAAGELTGVGGAALSRAEGEIAGHAAAGRSLGRRVDHADVRGARGLRARRRAFAAILQEAFPVPPGWLEWLAPGTIVCRCEEVTVSRIDTAIEDLGASDPRTVKLLARPGMGPCQGRVCGYATACLVAARTGRATTADDIAGLAARPIAQPVSLGLLAGADADTG
jgi:NADPH-dependent 2,4-dienoyl-CoA reductase/sulfur reductase-like enzyme